MRGIASLATAVAMAASASGCGSRPARAKAPPCGNGEPKLTVGRPANADEQKAVRAAVRESPATSVVRRRLGPGCTIANIRVARTDPRYGVATMNVRGLEHALVILRRTSHWRVLYLGTGRPACSLVPHRVERELLRGNCVLRA